MTGTWSSPFSIRHVSPTSTPRAAPPTVSRGRWAPTWILEKATTRPTTSSPTRSLTPADGHRTVTIENATAVWPETKPRPSFGVPTRRTIASSSSAGRPLFTIALTTLASCHAATPPMTTPAVGRQERRRRQVAHPTAMGPHRLPSCIGGHRTGSSHADCSFTERNTCRSGSDTPRRASRTDPTNRVAATTTFGRRRRSGRQPRMADQRSGAPASPRRASRRLASCSSSNLIADSASIGR